MEYRDNSNAHLRIGLIGSGFVSSGLVLLLNRYPNYQVTGVLTRRDPASAQGYPRPDLLTNTVDELIENADLIIECCGDVVYATAVLVRVLEAGLPVVTMDAELHVTTGSYLMTKGFITEAEGDQPGSLAALKEECLLMGLDPLVYGNVKWFLNHHPSPEEMAYWSKKQGISLTQVTSFTDGTKVQIEQALVANGLGADILQDGLSGLESEMLEDGAVELAALAENLGRPVSDYLRARKAPPGVFITGRHDQQQAPFLKYYKLGDGPYYTIVRPYHLCHLEIPKTIKRVISGGGALLTNSEHPRISVESIAKRPFKPGEVIKRAIGSFEIRGEAIKIVNKPHHVPIGLLRQAVVKEAIEPGQRITFSDVDLPDSAALQGWQEILSRCLTPAAEVGVPNF